MVHATDLDGMTTLSGITNFSRGSLNGGSLKEEKLNGGLLSENNGTPSEKALKDERNASSVLEKPVKDSRRKNALQIIDKRTGLEYEIPIKRNAIDAIEFRKIRAPNEDGEAATADNSEQGLRLLDPGMQNTAAKESRITYVDGQKGTIQFRGHRIDDLVGRRKYEEVVYLLLWEHLPSDQERTVYSMSLATYPLPPPSAFAVIKSFPPDAPPVMMMIAGFTAVNAARPQEIPACQGENLYMGNMPAVDRQIIRASSSLAAITAMVYCHKTGREFTPPDPNFSYIENVLLMMGHVDPLTRKPDPKTVSYLERLWVLTADHELTNSANTFLSVASGLNDLMTCMIAGMCSSWGILHGGAIEMAYKQIQGVGSVDKVPELIKMVKAGKMRLFGYGHRIYKTIDPRFTHIQEMVQELAKEAGDDGEKSILPIAVEIDRIARDDEYFNSRKLKPNADFLASFVYTGLGFPADFILPLSMLARTPGSLAHWREAMTGPARIWRPQQIYTGAMSPT